MESEDSFSATVAKRNYFKAKFLYKKQRLEQDFDQKYKEQFGFNGIQELLRADNEFFSDKDIMNDEKLPEINAKFCEKDKEFILGIKSDFFREEKLEHIYQYHDFYSDKSRIRKHIADNYKNKLSVDDVNRLLNELVDKYVFQTLGKHSEQKLLNKSIDESKFELEELLAENFGADSPG